MSLTREELETMTKEELMDKIMELQDLNEAKANETDAPVVKEKKLKRLERAFYITGGRFVMEYMLDVNSHGTYQFTNNKKIIADTKERLEHAGENSKGLCISFNKEEIMLNLFSYTENGLDMLAAGLTKKMNECLAKLEDGTLRRPTVRRSQPHKTHYPRPRRHEPRPRPHHTPQHSRHTPSYPSERGYRRSYRDNSNYRGYH